MSFPRYSEVDLALLLELVRMGRAVRPHETYDRVTRHFPHLTEGDKTALRKDGRTRVWTNMIHWARDHLRVQNALSDRGPGVWAVNDRARALLEGWLRNRGSTDVEAFVDSDSPLHQYLGVNWARELRPRTFRPRIPVKPDKGPEAPVVETAAAEPAPTSDLQTLQERHVDRVCDELLARLQAMDEYEFENFVGRVLDALGFRDTVVVGRPGDGGVDVKCVLRNELVEASVAVQVKRQQTNVGPKDISYLRDRWARKSDKLLFITTGGYTAGAREVAEEEGLKPVTLVEGRQLAELMVRLRVGVTSHVVEQLLIDDEFFAG